MTLADYIDANQQRLIDRWKNMVEAELSLALDESELLDDLPDVVDDLVLAAREPTGRWPDLESARSHGRHRMQIGFDLGRLTVEMALIAEALLSLADEDGHSFSCGQMQSLFRIISHGTRASVEAYGQMRDRQLAEQASMHFSFIAHEIRNPLQNAMLATTLIERGTNAARPRYIERLRRSLAQLSDLVDNSLLEARLLESPGVDPEPLDAAELVADATEDIVSYAETRGVELGLEIEPFELQADRKLLRSALSNLIKNAVKFTAENTRVTVRARSEDEQAVFEIEDQCGGIPAAITEQLFEPFVQAADDRRGFGLGLAIVKQAVDAHGGRVHVENLSGHGCRFSIELPQPLPTSES